MDIDPNKLRQAARDYVSGRGILRQHFPDISPASLDLLAITLHGPFDTTPAETPKAAASAAPKKARTTRKSANKGSNMAGVPVTTPKLSLAVCVDLGNGSKVPLADAIVSMMQRKPRGIEMTLSQILDEFNQLGWKTITKNEDHTFPMRSRIQAMPKLFSWRTDGSSKGSHLFTLTGKPILSTETRTILDSFFQARLSGHAKSSVKNGSKSTVKNGVSAATAPN